MYARFSPKTLSFLTRASRQKRADWLDKNRDEYEKVLQKPLQRLAHHLKAELQDAAPAYHFPQKGIGRIKRSANRAREHGSHYKGYLSYSASRPSASRFDRNPSLFFMINPEDKKDSVLIAGGLYMPSSRQTRAIREAIRENTAPFDRLFASKDFARVFQGGFSREKSSSRVPRGFDPAHPRLDWIRLQAFFVWRPYTRKEFASKGFPALVARDCRQIIRLNDLLEVVIQGRAPKTTPPRPGSSGLLERLSGAEAPRRPMDF